MKTIISIIVLLLLQVSSLIVCVLIPILIALAIARLLTKNTTSQKLPFLWQFPATAFVISGLISGTHYLLLIGSVYVQKESPFTLFFAPFNFLYYIQPVGVRYIAPYTEQHLAALWLVCIVLTLSLATVLTIKSKNYQKAPQQQSIILKQALLLMTMYISHLNLTRFTLLSLGYHSPSQLPSYLAWISMFEEAQLMLAYGSTAITCFILLIGIPIFASYFLFRFFSR